MSGTGNGDSGSTLSWQRQAAAAARRVGRLGADSPDEAVWSALARTTVESLVVPPLGLPHPLSPALPADTAGVLPAAAGAARPDGPGGGWDVRPQIIDPDPAAAARLVFDEWRADSTSLWLTVGGPGTDPAALRGALSRVPLDQLPILVSAAGPTTDLQAAQALAEVLRSSGGIPAVGGSLGADPVGRLLDSRYVNAAPAAPAGVDDLAAEVDQLAATASELGIGALIADGNRMHLAGAGDATEVGYVLACGVQYLRSLTALGYSIRDSLPLLEFRLAATDDQFVTLAKFRAVRMLWRRIAGLCGADSTAMRVHAVTSAPMMTRYDPWTNLLRTTVAAFAAGVGGASALTVLPFDAALGIPSGQGRPLARNISALLLSEAHVADVRDPAGGSWAIDTFTDTVADAAWTQFQLLEQGGGVISAMTDGVLDGPLQRTSAERTRRINTRAQPLTGVTEFPDPDEQLLVRTPYPGNSPQHSRTSSWASEFESLRDRPMTQPVFLATLGPVSAHGARAGFAANALAAGGIAMVSAGATATVQDVLDAYLRMLSPVVCIAGTDAAYQSLLEPVVHALRAQGADRLLLSGRPTPEAAVLVDDCLAAGDDVLAFLHRTRQALTRAGSPISAEGTAS